MNTDCGQTIKTSSTPETESVTSEQIVMEICEAVDTIYELSMELSKFIYQHTHADNPDRAIMNCQIEQINSLSEIASMHTCTLMNTNIWK